MHYFSDKFLKTAKRWELSSPAPLNLQYWWSEGYPVIHKVIHKVIQVKIKW